MEHLAIRICAALCYLAALRVLVTGLLMPQWAFAVPSLFLINLAFWWYGRRRSPFLLHHARTGFRWSLQANLLMAALAALSALFHLVGARWAFPYALTAWHLMATVVRWAGVLVAILTALAMARALRGQTADPFAVEGATFKR